MEDKQIQITKKFEFSASHRYWREDWTDEKNNEIYFSIINNHQEVFSGEKAKLDENSKLIVDSRNAFETRGIKSKNIFKA